MSEFLPFWGGDGRLIDFLLPRTPRTLIGDVTVTIHRHILFTDSVPGESVLYQLGNEITSMQWRHNRIGGCGTGEFVLNDRDLYRTSNLKKLLFPDHNYLRDLDLYGGIVKVWVRLFPVPTIVTDPVSTEVYMGIIKDIELDAGSREITLTTEGLSSTFDDIYMQQDFENQTIRAIISAIVDPLVKGPAASFQSGALRGTSVFGGSCLLDMVIPSIKAKGERASSVLKRVMDFLPGRYVWGVDRQGIFYLQPQDEVYDDGVGQLAVDGYFVSNSVSWKRNYKPGDQPNVFTVYGGEDPDDDSVRVNGKAACLRMVYIQGGKEVTSKEADIEDSSLCAKLAQSIGREAAIEAVSGTLEVVEKITPQKTFRHALAPFSAPIYINESGQAHDAIGATVGNSLKLNGKIGEYFTLPHNSLYNLNTDWLLHIAVAFDSAPEVAGNNFVFGRMDTNFTVSGINGWGWINWDGTSGNLSFKWTDAATNTNVTTPMSINVPIAGPFPIIKYITIGRDTTGSFNFFDGVTRVAAVGETRNQKTGGTFDGGYKGFVGYFAPYGRHNGRMDSFWFYDTRNIRQQFGYGFSWLTAVSFLLGDNATSRFKINWRGNYTGTVGAPGLIAWSEMVEDQVFMNGSFYPTVKHGYDGSVAFGTMNRISSTAGTALSTATFTGRQWNQGLRWGGPLVLNYDSVTYQVSPRLTKCRKVFELGSRALLLENIVSSTKERIAILDEIDRKASGAK